MENETDFEEERKLEVEDFDLSDVEETQVKESEGEPISIDYNSRIAQKLHEDAKEKDSCLYENVSNISKYQVSDRDVLGDTSCEELDVSDEDAPSVPVIQRVILDGICCIASNRHSDAASSFNYSSTSFKGAADAECMAEDDIQIQEGLLNSFDRPGLNLSSGLSVAPSVNDAQGLSFSSNVANSYSSSLSLKKKSHALNTTDSLNTPLMTCLEFLKSEHSDDDGTDVEDISIDSSDLKVIKEEAPYNVTGLSQNIIENAAGHRGMTNFFDLHKGRKSSLTTEILLDDDSSNGENEIHPTEVTLNRKRLSNAGDYGHDCPTDEEDLDLVDHKEWTETDESGDVRQITQIKTETSIKLEGDGGGSGFDSDDLVSTTATTTTRVVTSVITNPDEEGDIDSTFVQQVTFKDVLNDRSTSEPGESGCEE